MVELQIEVEGNLTEHQISQGMKIFAELVINKIKSNIRAMDLISKTGAGGAYLQGWLSKWDATTNTLHIENTQAYSVYLEYGTFSYFTQYGEDSFPESVQPKKKDMVAKLRKSFPKGMQPFAPVRRVLYNDTIVDNLLKIAFGNISI